MNDKKTASQSYYERNKAKVIARSEQWRLANKEKIAEIHRKYRASEKGKAAWQKHYEANKEKIIARTKAHQKKPEVIVRTKEARHLKGQKRKVKQYGLTIEQYDQMLESQNHVCAICFQPETAFDSRLKVTKKLAIDHCHKTAKIRGLLCSRCNLGLGRFEDSIEIFKSIIEYLSN